MKIALIGCGNIGGTLAESINELNNKLILSGVYDIDPKTALEAASRVKPAPRIYRSIDELIKDSSVELVVEAASQEAVRSYGRKILESGKSIMVLSVGAFTDEDLFKEMRDAAERKGLKIYIPSGAIAGVDGLKAASVGNLKTVSLITRKTPKSLGVRVEKETVLYDGPALEGVKRYPKNVNVAAALSLAGLGFEKTKLKIIADPAVDKNKHQIEMSGDFGSITIYVENHPSQRNPKTSYLAIYSAMATLKKITEAVQIGT